MLQVNSIWEVLPNDGGKHCAAVYSVVSVLFEKGVFVVTVKMNCVSVFDGFGK
jgi:hypothetical protein